MSSYMRVAYSPDVTGTQIAEIKLGKGEWEIDSATVIMGGRIPALNGLTLGMGDISFVVMEADGTTVREKHYLMTGRCSVGIPMLINRPKRVFGPGRIRSTIVHLETTEHTLTAIYRRISG